MNVAVFDAVMVAIYDCAGADNEAISNAYSRLVRDDEFMKLSGEATSDDSNVHGGINMAIEAINAVG